MARPDGACRGASSPGVAGGQQQNHAGGERAAAGTEDKSRIARQSSGAVAPRLRLRAARPVARRQRISEVLLRGWINHLDLTVSDLAVSVPFYDALLGHLGFERLEPAPGGRPVWHARDERLRLFGIGLCEARAEQRGKPHDRFAPGLHHVAFQAASRADVDGLHRLLQAMRRDDPRSAGRLSAVLAGLLRGVLR